MANIEWDRLVSVKTEAIASSKREQSQAPAWWQRWLFIGSMIGLHVLLLGGFLVWQGIVPVPQFARFWQQAPAPQPPPRAQVNLASVAPPPPPRPRLPVRPPAAPVYYTPPRRAPAPPPAKKADPPKVAAKPQSPQEVLKQKGLVRRRSQFISEEEANVARARKEAETAYKTWENTLGLSQTITGFELTMQDSKLREITLNGQVEELKLIARDIPGNRRWRTGQQEEFLNDLRQLESQLNMLRTEMRLMNQQAPTKDQREQAEGLDGAATERDNQLKHLGEMIDSVHKTYDGLASDPEVRRALNLLSRQEHANITLGPSEEFLAAENGLIRLQAALRGRLPRAKSKHK